MTINYNVDENGRFKNITTFPVDESQPTIELDEAFDISKIADYRLVDGGIVHDPIPKQDETEAPQSPYVTWDDLVAALQEGVNGI